MSFSPCVRPAELQAAPASVSSSPPASASYLRMSSASASAGSISVSAILSHSEGDSPQLLTDSCAPSPAPPLTIDPHVQKKRRVSVAEANSLFQDSSPAASAYFHHGGSVSVSLSNTHSDSSNSSAASSARGSLVGSPSNTGFIHTPSPRGIPSSSFAFAVPLHSPTVPRPMQHRHHQSHSVSLSISSPRTQPQQPIMGRSSLVLPPEQQRSQNAQGIYPPQLNLGGSNSSGGLRSSSHPVSMTHTPPGETLAAASQATPHALFTGISPSQSMASLSPGLPSDSHSAPVLFPVPFAVPVPVSVPSPSRTTATQSPHAQQFTFVPVNMNLGMGMVPAPLFIPSFPPQVPTQSQSQAQAQTQHQYQNQTPTHIQTVNAAFNLPSNGFSTPSPRSASAQANPYFGFQVSPQLARTSNPATPNSKHNQSNSSSFSTSSNFSTGVSAAPESAGRDVTQISNYLLAVPLLAKLSAAELDILAAALGERTYPARSTIIREGDVGNEFFILKSGHASLQKEGSPICTLRQGDYFGEQALMTGTARTASVIAGSEECTVFVLSRDSFQSLFGPNKFNVLFAKRSAVSSESTKPSAPESSAAQPPDKEAEDRIYTKSPEEINFLRQVVRSHVLFENLPESQQKSLVEFMYLKRFRLGQRVIQQGEPGNFWCVVKRGMFEIHKRPAQPANSKSDASPSLAVVADEPTRLPAELIPENAVKVASCPAGASFGELALLYNSPRTASVIAVEDSEVWILDRNIFRRGLQNSYSAQYYEYEQFLVKVQSFHVLLDYERSKIAEALEYVRYPNGHEICRQGELGSIFFIVKSGLVGVFQDGIEVSRLGAGQFFGERALLKKEERNATCVALGPVECLYLNRDAFIALLGPLEEIFQRKMERDEKHNERHIKARQQQRQIANGESAQEDASSSSGSGSVVKSVSLQPPRIMVDPNELPPPINSPAIAKQRPDSIIPDYIAINELAVIGTLGRGSFGLVQLVRDATGQTFALKTVSKQRIVELDQQDHILNEKRTMQSLNHWSLVRLIATHKDRNHLYFLFEPSLGGELFSVLRARTYFDEATARFYAASVILAFEYLHSRGIIYRDLKPENLLLDKDGYLKVTDFGFAKEIGDGRTWTLCGTPDYLAPEVITNQGHGRSVDWWTLGIFIFEMLASYPPFYDEDPMKTYAKILQNQIQWPVHFSPAARDLIGGLLCPKPTKRLGVILGGAATIKYHHWFAGFDWAAFEARRIRAPIVCKVRSDEDLSNFECYLPPAADPAEAIEYRGDPKNPDWDKDF